MDNDSFSHHQDIEDILRGLESVKGEYPAELLSARRKFLIEQVEKRRQLASEAERDETDHRLIALLRSLKALDPQYPAHRLAHRRSLYQQQVFESFQTTIWTVIRFRVRDLFAARTRSHGSFSMKLTRAATLALGAAMMTFLAFALHGNSNRSTSSIPFQNTIITPTFAPATHATQTVVVCKNGYEPPLCLDSGLDHSPVLTNSGNGSARPAVAKDAFSEGGHVHDPAQINDGRYGSESSWVSNDPNSWVKIDLGITTDIDTVAFGRDRLGSSDGGDPGRFVIAVATSDDVYANGNSSNDEKEYVKVYDSQQAGFNGKISGPETVVAEFEMKQARFIKITFENAHTAIDEVEAFVSTPRLIAVQATRERRDQGTNQSASTPLPTATATAIPVDTLPPTPTVTYVPTDSPTPAATDTPTPEPIPTDLTIPPPINTPVSVPTSMPVVFPTDEPIPTSGTVVPLPDDRRELQDRILR